MSSAKLLALALALAAPAARAQGCPELRPLDPGDDECPGESDFPGERGDDLVWYFSCNDPALEVGFVCKSNNGECSTSKDLNNCRYPLTETKVKADLYVVTAVADGSRPDETEDEEEDGGSTPSDRACPKKLRPLEEDECPGDGELVWFFSCDDPALEEGDWCKSNNGECDTSKDLNNCRYPLTDAKVKADLYLVQKAADPPEPGDDCPELRALTDDECPAEGELVWYFSCDDPALVEGDWCKSNDGECGTSKKENNCRYPLTESNVKADLYIVTRAAEPSDDDPSPLPPVDGCPTLEIVARDDCPDSEEGELVWYFSCDDPALVEGDLCKSNNGECGTSKDLDNCRYPADAPKQKADIYRVTKAAEGGDTPKPSPKPSRKPTSKPVQIYSPTPRPTPRPTRSAGKCDPKWIEYREGNILEEDTAIGRGKKGGGR